MMMAAPVEVKRRGGFVPVGWALVVLRPTSMTILLMLGFLLGSACRSNGGGEAASSGRSPSGGSTPSHAPPAPNANLTVVAQAKVPRLEVRAEPEAPAARQTLANPTDDGGPLVFLVREQANDWLLVDLPVRPNGSTGWIRATDVTLSKHDFRVVVELGAHRITVHQGDTVILNEPVGVGRANTPTPGGRFYIKELLRPPDPTTVYGPYAYGLSGFSNVLTSFAGGPGVIGIHGNNAASSLGRDVSSGCIRMSNEGITRLSKILPLGTPVEIRP